MTIRKSKTTEYRIWLGMRQRCGNPKTDSWHRYGGRGISVCDRWLSFDAFLADMGKRPSPSHTLDRKDNDGPYSLENCRWATREVQNRNRSDNVWLQLGDERRNLTDWASKLGITKQALRFRLRSDEWSYVDALTVSVKRQVRGDVHRLSKLLPDQVDDIRRRRANGELLRVLAGEYGVSEALISSIARRKKNWLWKADPT